ncbi:LptF/LptG family permease [Candidatus Sumerlaeota bacterium]|nr:LptF/LptG family permease [Candidatus Sumerlaeota bacterium]
MIPYVDRDLIRSFFQAFLTITAFVLVGYFVSVVLDQYRFMFTGSKFWWVLYYFLITIPRQASYIIPVGTAVSILWVYTVKARNNELLAYLVGGVSPLRLARPLLIVSAVLAVACYMTIEFLANPGDRIANVVERVKIQEKGQDVISTEKNVFKKGQGNRFYNIKSYSSVAQTMDQPTIIDMGEKWNLPSWRVDADRAEFRDDKWYFKNATFRRFNEAGAVTQYDHFDKDVTAKELGIELEEELGKYLRERFRANEMGFMELVNYIGLFREQGQSTAKLQTQLYFNFVIPLGAFVLAVLMCGHILRPSSAGVVVSFGGGLVLLAIYYIIIVMVRQLSLYGMFPPLVSAVVPNLFFLAFGLYLLHRDRALV